jgi:hypothetical protein
MSTVEKLHFKLGLAGTYWDKQPVYSVYINDSVIVQSASVTAASEEVFYIEFNAEVAEGSTASLTVALENKTNQDTVKDDDTREDFTILKDMLLHIKSIEVEEIDLGSLIYTKSIYVGNDPARPTLDNCIDLGWNGKWTLQFESPFYIWLLENI